MKVVKPLGSGGGVGGTGVGVTELAGGCVEGFRVRDSHSLVTDCRSDRLGEE